MNARSLSKAHAKLIEKLKTAMIKGIKVNFLEIAEILFQIKNKKTYLSEDPTYTFSEFCLKTKAPIPGNTPHGRRITVLKLIKVYEVLYKEFKVTKSKIKNLGYNKSYELASNIGRIQSKKQLDSLISKAKEISNQGLRKILKCDPSKKVTRKTIITIFYDSKGNKITETEKNVEL